MKMFMIGLAFATLAVASFAAPAPAAQKKSIVIAGGCFWCVEAIYEDLKGVLDVESGYTGGTVKNPTYEQVCSGTTGHAEAVKITYDANIISSRDLLRIFFTTHDPTTLNAQGPDTGTQYRSAIFYSNEAEKKVAQEIIKQIADEKLYRDPIVTTLEPLKDYYKAEAYHQDYFKNYEKATPAKRSGMNARYCAAVIEPKVRKFREKYATKLRKGG